MTEPLDKSDSEARLSVGLRSYAIIGVICVLFFGGASIGVLLAHQYSPIAIFAVFFSLGAALCAAAGTLGFDRDGVSYASAYGQFRMAWRDVRQIEFSQMGTVVLHGADRRFVIFPSSYWSGPHCRKAAEVLANAIRETGVVPTLSRTADYRLFKNVRVRG
jgi:hypothetical protein